MSRIIKFAQAGGPEILEFIEMEVAPSGSNGVRIKVNAIGINRAGSMWRNDKYSESPILPANSGYDGAGVVLFVCQASEFLDAGLQQPKGTLEKLPFPSLPLSDPQPEVIQPG